jgi:hypothetical protein
MNSRQVMARARAALKVWRVRLGLSDWDIGLEFDEAGELDAEGTYAMCTPDPERLAMTITFHLAPHRAEPHHIEATIAHELVHAVLSPIMHALDAGLTREEAMGIEEQAVVRIERAMFETYPGATRRRVKEHRSTAGPRRRGATRLG